MVAKYKVGDYLRRPHHGSIEIKAVIDTGDMPVYALYNIRKKPSILWVTEYEMEMQECTKKEIDFALWKTVQVGEYVRERGHHDDRDENARIYKILAVVGEVVLLSYTPMKGNMAEINAVTEALDELETLEESDEVLSTLTKEIQSETRQALANIKPFTNTKGSHSIAQEEWLTFDQLAVSDMELIRE